MVNAVIEQLCHASRVRGARLVPGNPLVLIQQHVELMGTMVAV
jgi:hypothetical protein